MNNKNVLFVDDSILFRGAVASALRNAGYSIVTAKDGEEALGSIRDQRPDLIVLDMLLPKVGGLQVLRDLKSDPATSQIPVIILSCLSQKNAASLKTLGAAAYIEKSHTNASTLVEAVEQIIGVSSAEQLSAGVDKN